MKIVGIDEAGRGPLAGPVTVGLVVCEAEEYARLKRDRRLPSAGRDSKKLSPAAREKYAEIIRAMDTKDTRAYSGFRTAVVHVSSTVIDRRGISSCLKQAVARGFQKLSLNPVDCLVLLDGSLHAPAEFRQKTIIKGDEKEKIIAWASILAKVSRDALMRSAHKKYPDYGFHIHKGYGTTAHISAIRRHGLSKIHRRTFCRRFD